MEIDNRDYSDKFNTVLSNVEQNNFDQWASKQSATVGRDINKDLYDYDLKGWWKSNQNVDLQGGHLTDQFKKPNHPTFSTGSQYHGTQGFQGGEWSQQKDGSWNFIPGNTNLQNFSVDELKNYFKQVEPGNQLVLPQ